MFSLKDKVIVVTGGNGLLGKQMVDTFRKYSAKTIAADLLFENKGPDDFIFDITDPQIVRSTIATIVKKYGKIDGWVNNAYPRTKDWGTHFENINIDSWRMNVDMHLNGYFICCQAILEQMNKQRQGSLINMSSIYGLVGPDFTVYEGTDMTMPAAYSVIKGGINNLTRYLASYFGSAHVRINSVSPGGLFDNQNELFVMNYVKKVPLKRMGTPMDVVAAVFFLLSDESSYITGHNLVVDGGWSAI